MVNGTPLFTGSSEESQLDTIFRHLGTPDEVIFPELTELPEYKRDFPFYPAPASLQSLVPTLEESGVKLLTSMLTYNPANRITAQEARHHPFFNDLPDSYKKMGNDMH